MLNSAQIPTGISEPRRPRRGTSSIRGWSGWKWKARRSDQSQMSGSEIHSWRGKLLFSKHLFMVALVIRVLGILYFDYLRECFSSLFWVHCTLMDWKKLVEPLLLTNNTFYRDLHNLERKYNNIWRHPDAPPCIYTTYAASQHHNVPQNPGWEPLINLQSLYNELIFLLGICALRTDVEKVWGVDADPNNVGRRGIRYFIGGGIDVNRIKTTLTT